MYFKMPSAEIFTQSAKHYGEKFILKRHTIYIDREK